MCKEIQSSDRNIQLDGTWKEGVLESGGPAFHTSVSLACG